MKMTLLSLAMLSTSTLFAHADFFLSQEVFPSVMMSVVVNIEGKIVEVSLDGKSFKLDNGTWVKVTKETQLGIEGPTAPPKEKQYFEPTFRVGNSISGYTQNPNAKVVIAYAIYNNWNWENPIKRK